MSTPITFLHVSRNGVFHDIQYFSGLQIVDLFLYCILQKYGKNSLKYSIENQGELTLFDVKTDQKMLASRA